MCIHHTDRQTENTLSLYSILNLKTLLSLYSSVIWYPFLKADCAMLKMSWITAILQLNSQVAELFGNVIAKRINIRHFDLLARFHYILNLPR